MIDAWKKTDETYRLQVRAELSTGRCGDERYEEIFDDLCPQAMRIPPGVPEVRISEMVTTLWVVTGLTEDARRAMPREGQSDAGPRTGPQSRSADGDRAYETVSPTKAKSIAQERSVTDTIEKQRREAIAREMPRDLEESQGEKQPLPRSLPFNDGPEPMAPAPAEGQPTDPIAMLTTTIWRSVNRWLPD